MIECRSIVTINTQKFLENLEKPDTLIQRNIQLTSGNPIKAFMYLKLGLLPARFLIMENFLKYIIRGSFFFMIRQVYETFKMKKIKKSIKWDFIVNLLIVW